MNKVDQLENELKLYKEGRHTNLNNSHDGTDTINLINEENRRLKAENNVLQKKFAGKKTKYSLIFTLESILFEELSAKTAESISTASSSNESFQKEDVEVECDDNRYLSRLFFSSRNYDHHGNLNMDT
jgi:hypothetical protein